MARARDFPPEGYLARSIEAQRALITEVLADLDVPLHPGSRLVKGWRLWDGRPEDQRTIYETEPDFRNACEILRDSQIYDVVLQRPCQFREDPQALERLADSSKDDLTPHLQKPTPGRDAQAELFMASGMYRANQQVRFERLRDQQMIVLGHRGLFQGRGGHLAEPADRLHLARRINGFFQRDRAGTCVL